MNCTKCGIDKPAEAFSKNRRQCRECRRKLVNVKAVSTFRKNRKRELVALKGGSCHYPSSLYERFASNL